MLIYFVLSFQLEGLQKAVDCNESYYEMERDLGTCEADRSRFRSNLGTLKQKEERLKKELDSLKEENAELATFRCDLLAEISETNLLFKMKSCCVNFYVSKCIEIDASDPNCKIHTAEDFKANCINT